ncbi:MULTISPECIES: serine/threonine-protein phosphatase [Streptomyces]|uniref:serine/threonine-protein phosphatase n=1 Tax=Streptomyces lycopersici TaxID=2974589 RepID=UPI0021CE1666|nr:serine/threonine-protein phosphatase [Streptomyces sp. NEAU-383]
MIPLSGARVGLVVGDVAGHGLQATATMGPDLPFECTEVRLAPGSTLALFTDGLVNDGHGNIDAGVADLCRVLERPGITPTDACKAIAAWVDGDQARDDAALLLVRVHALAEGSMAAWSIPADPAEVARARAQCLRQLAAWDLDEVGSVVELIVSELVTNAIRPAPRGRGIA